MSSVWYETLAAIDICNKVSQARDATLDVDIVTLKLILKIRCSYRVTRKEPGIKS